MDNAETFAAMLQAEIVEEAIWVTEPGDVLACRDSLGRWWPKYARSRARIDHPNKPHASHPGWPSVRVANTPDGRGVNWPTDSILNLTALTKKNRNG